MRDLSLFAGAGGGILAGEILGWNTTHAVEIDPFARKVLALRWPDLQISEDVREFNGKALRGQFDVVSGGFPCQDISSAGKRLGINGPKSGLWFHFARIIEETEPPFAFVENSPRLRTNGLDRILRDLASLGFDAEWSDLSAQALGAAHRRNRMWILATHPQRIQLWEQQRRIGGTYGPLASLSRIPCTIGDPSNDHSMRELQQGRSTPHKRGWPGHPYWWASEPPVARVVHGLANRSHRLKCLGNGQVPVVAALAFVTLAKRFGIHF